MNGNLYITGFMGAGKSTLGRDLAQTLGRRFVDLDEEVARGLGMSIAQAFERLGQEAFRQAETAQLKRLRARRGLVVATGGGLPQRPENRQLMRASGRILYLRASLAECRSRLDRTGMEQRPLWSDPEALQGLWQDRQAAYEDCDLALAVDGQGPAELVEQALDLLYPGKRFTVRLGQTDSPVICTWQGPQALAEVTAGRRVMLLSDRNLARFHLPRYQGLWPQAHQFILPPGEGCKSLTMARRVYEAMLVARLERGDMLVALGGGVVTDLGAFIAATYKRGLDFALVATSLVGCVDAAVGGKAAVNLGRAKNVVGCFTKPRAVVLDLRALGTLSRRHIAEGLVEAYKTGLVAAPELAQLVEDELGPLLAGEVGALSQVAQLSAQAKAGVVSRDFRETGLRRILNLGHTFGHAVEGYGRFRVSHGRAVALGLLVAAALSAGRGLISQELYQRVKKTLERIVPRRPAWPPLDQAWEIMLNDKKNQKGQVQWVLLEGVGRPLCGQEVSPEELAQALSLAKGE